MRSTCLIIISAALLVSQSERSGKEREEREAATFVFRAEAAAESAAVCRNAEDAKDENGALGFFYCCCRAESGG